MKSVKWCSVNFSNGDGNFVATRSYDLECKITDINIGTPWAVILLHKLLGGRGHM